MTTAADLDRERIAAVHRAERERFAAAHPRSRELFERARGSLVSGVPMTWMARRSPRSSAGCAPTAARR